MVKMTMKLANMAIAPKNTNAKEKKRWQLHLSWLWSKWQWQWQWQKLMSMMAPYWQNGFWRLFKLPWKHFQYPWFVSQLSRFLRTKNKLGWVCCQTIIRDDNIICGDSNVYLCHCNILKEELFMKQFSLLFQPPRESFGQNRGCIVFYHRQVIQELDWSEITPPHWTPPHRTDFLVPLLKSSSNWT